MEHVPFALVYLLLRFGRGLIVCVQVVSSWPGDPVGPQWAAHHRVLLIRRPWGTVRPLIQHAWGIHSFLGHAPGGFFLEPVECAAPTFPIWGNQSTSLWFFRQVSFVDG